MNMNLLQTNSYANQISAELPALDLVGELLTMTLSRFDMEVIIESPGFIYDQESGIETFGLLETKIDYEKVFEDNDMLEIVLSGSVKNQFGVQEALACFFL